MGSWEAGKLGMGWEGSERSRAKRAIRTGVVHFPMLSRVGCDVHFSRRWAHVNTYSIYTVP